MQNIVININISENQQAIEKEQGLNSLNNDPTTNSPHSGYVCVIGCGNDGTTPPKDFYYDVTSKDKQILLQDYYKSINTDPSYSNVYHPENITKEEKK